MMQELTRMRWKSVRSTRWMGQGGDITSGARLARAMVDGGEESPRFGMAVCTLANVRRGEWAKTPIGRFRRLW